MLEFMLRADSACTCSEQSLEVSGNSCIPFSFFYRILSTSHANTDQIFADPEIWIIKT
jgi:hypothetical protein